MAFNRRGSAGALSTALYASVLLADIGLAAAAGAQEPGPSFVENFDRLDRKRWYISDGWSNGPHQNCTWSKDLVRSEDGRLKLGFEKRQAGDRSYACGEIQTHKRFGYGTYEARIKAVRGSGMNTGFFSFIGPVHKQPHDEVDFEVLGKDPSAVQVNYYVGGKGGNEKLVPVPGGADAGFNDYAFVWEPNRIRWYVNGELVHESTDAANLPSHASKIYFSLWASDNMTSWLGAFEEPQGPLWAEIDRVAFTALGDACQFPESVACALD